MEISALDNESMKRLRGRGYIKINGQEAFKLWVAKQVQPPAVAFLRRRRGSYEYFVLKNPAYVQAVRHEI